MKIIGRPTTTPTNPAKFGCGEGSPYAVLYTPQTLTEERQAQAKENIGASTYYHTAREEVGAKHEEINSAYIWGLYDALMEAYPNNVHKHAFHSNDGNFTNYVYEISTLDYSTDGEFTKSSNGGQPDLDIRKPKYLILSGRDGCERNGALSVYRFIRDALNGHNVPQSFKEGVIIQVMPVGYPDGFDRFSYDTEFNVEKNDTQALINWLKANTDADLFVDLHNGSALNEIVAIIGPRDSNDAVNAAKKIALKGVDRVIPFWKDVIGNPSEVEVITSYDYDSSTKTYSNIKLGYEPVIYSYCASWATGGQTLKYVINTLSIPGFTMEVADYHGNYSEYNPQNEDGTYTIPPATGKYQPEAIAAGAEAIGNILLEFYAQSFMSEVVDDMKEVNSKLDTLLQRASFRIESGTLVIEEDMTSPQGYVTVDIPCSSGAKLFAFYADDSTLDAIQKTTGVNYCASAIGNNFEQKITNYKKAPYTGYMTVMSEYQYQGVSYGWLLMDNTCFINATNGISFKPIAMMKGTYHWTAYYWD